MCLSVKDKFHEKNLKGCYFSVFSFIVLYVISFEYVLTYRNKMKKNYYHTEQHKKSSKGKHKVIHTMSTKIKSSTLIL